MYLNAVIPVKNATKEVFDIFFIERPFSLFLLKASTLLPSKGLAAFGKFTAIFIMGGNFFVLFGYQYSMPIQKMGLL